MPCGLATWPRYLARVASGIPSAAKLCRCGERAGSRRRITTRSPYVVGSVLIRRSMRRPAARDSVSPFAALAPPPTVTVARPSWADRLSATSIPAITLMRVVTLTARVAGSVCTVCNDPSTRYRTSVRSRRGTTCTSLASRRRASKRSRSTRRITGALPCVLSRSRSVSRSAAARSCSTSEEPSMTVAAGSSVRVRV